MCTQHRCVPLAGLTAGWQWHRVWKHCTLQSRSAWSHLGLECELFEFPMPGRYRTTEQILCSRTTGQSTRSRGLKCSKFGKGRWLCRPLRRSGIAEQITVNVMQKCTSLCSWEFIPEWKVLFAFKSLIFETERVVITTVVCDRCGLYSFDLHKTVPILGLS